MGGRVSAGSPAPRRQRVASKVRRGLGHGMEEGGVGRKVRGGLEGPSFDLVP